jgi:hypothetical protein
MIKIALFLIRAVALSALVYQLVAGSLYSDAALLAISTLIGLFIVCFLYNLSVLRKHDVKNFWAFKRSQWRAKK